MGLLVLFSALVVEMELPETVEKRSASDNAT
jgi:hypothetical protein